MSLPDWQRAQLASLLDALDGIPISDRERRILVWLASWERETVEVVAELVSRARQVGTTRAGDS